jgi:cell division protein FtsL
LKITILKKISFLFLIVTMLNGCAFMVAKETARAITIVAEDSKAKSENKKKNNEHRDEKQSVIDCIKMVVYCD